MNNSFVVTIDNERYSAFESWLTEAGVDKSLFPKKFRGYEIEEEYLIKNFKVLEEQSHSLLHGLLDINLSLCHALCNNASHFSIVQIAKFTNMPFVTIFEDDARPVSGFIDKVNSWCADIPDDIDVLRLGYSGSSDPRKENYIGNATRVTDCLIQKRFSGSQAYIVFNKYYDRFIEDNPKCPRCDFDKINPSDDKVVLCLKESVFKQCNIPGRPVIHSYKFADGTIKLPIVKY